MKQDQFVDFTTQVITYVTENSRKVIIITGIVILVLFGITSGFFIQKRYNEKAASILSQGISKFHPSQNEQKNKDQVKPLNTKDVKEALKLFEKCYKNFKRSKVAPQALYYESLAYLKLQKIDKALDSLTKFTNNYSNNPLLFEVMNLKACTLMNKGKYEDAVKDFSAIRNRFENSPGIALTMLRLGLCNFKLKKFEHASKIFNNIINNYSETPWSADAKEYLLLMPASAPIKEKNASIDSASLSEVSTNNSILKKKMSSDNEKTLKSEDIPQNKANKKNEKNTNLVSDTNKEKKND